MAELPKVEQYQITAVETVRSYLRVILALHRHMATKEEER